VTVLVPGTDVEAGIWVDARAAGGGFSRRAGIVVLDAGVLALGVGVDTARCVLVGDGAVGLLPVPALAGSGVGR
jgi:hypothetical protein